MDEGRYGDVSLDGLNFSVYANWPGAIHEGNGEAVILVDERADEEQRHAIDTLVGGDAGGQWGILGWTWPTVHGPHSARYDVEFAGRDSRIRAGEWLEVEMEPVTNPVTSAAVHPSVVLPEGIIFKQGELARSRLFRVRDGVAYDHSGQYTAVGPFQYSGP